MRSIFLSFGNAVNLVRNCVLAMVVLISYCGIQAQNYTRPQSLGTNLGNWCPFGTCDIATPVYMNVYWDTSFAQWNSDAAATSADLTVDRIDTMVQALVNSEYFQPLGEYSVSSVSVLPSIVMPSACGAAPTTLDTAHAELGPIGDCIVENTPQINPSIAILNILLPPQVSPGTDFCSPGNEDADHDVVGNSQVEVTFIPTNSSCLNLPPDSFIQALFHNMSHEMVEGASDPNHKSPTGWKEPFTSEGEIADICEDFPLTQALASNPGSQVSQQPFLYAAVSTFFAQVSGFGITNSFNFNVPGFCVPLPPPNVLTFVSTGTTASAFGPQITTAAVCGAGASMAMAAQVSDAGPTPFDLGPDGTVFFNVAVNADQRLGGQWVAGLHGFPPDQTTIGLLNWDTPDAGGNTLIRAFGFSAVSPSGTLGYGASEGGVNNAPLALVRPGDQLTLNVFDTQFGQNISITLPVENPSQITSLSVVSPPYTTSSSYVGPDNSTQWFFVNTVGVATGYVMGASNCAPSLSLTGPFPIEGSSITLRSSDGSDQFPTSNAGTLVTNNNGFFAQGYAPSYAGAKTVTASVQGYNVTSQAPLSVHPGLTSISPNLGPAGIKAVLTGAGFPQSPLPVVNFSAGSVNSGATGITVPSSDTVKLTVPSPPISLTDGYFQADVTASVDNVPSLPIDFTFVNAGQPVLRTNLQCRDNQLDVDVYDTKGNKVNETVSLSSTPAMFSLTTPVCSQNNSCPCQTSGAQNGTTSCVQTPGSVEIYVAGQIMATPQLSPSQTTTGQFNIAPCLPDFGAWVSATLSGYPQLGPSNPLRFNSVVGTNGVIWLTGGVDPIEAGNFVTMSTTSEAGLENRFNVGSLSISELRAALRQSPSILVLKESGSKTVSFTGQSIRISETTGKAEEKLRTKTFISFSLPDSKTSAGDYRIFHLTVRKGFGQWTELRTPKLAKRPARVISAEINETGLYALAITSK
jgi:hypothetical protein